MFLFFSNFKLDLKYIGIYVRNNMFHFWPPKLTYTVSF